MNTFLGWWPGSTPEPETSPRWEGKCNCNYRTFGTTSWCVSGLCSTFWGGCGFGNVLHTSHCWWRRNRTRQRRCQWLEEGFGDFAQLPGTASFRGSVLTYFSNWKIFLKHLPNTFEMKPFQLCVLTKSPWFLYNDNNVSYVSKIHEIKSKLLNICWIYIKSKCKIVSGFTAHPKYDGRIPARRLQYFNLRRILPHWIEQRQCRSSLAKTFVAHLPQIIPSQMSHFDESNRTHESGTSSKNVYNPILEIIILKENC